jgi:IPT/TIG domain
MAKPIQRINYHTGLFLEEAEFQLEQNYHLSMRQRINYAVFKPGVLYGMALDYTGGVLKVTAGMAIDETNDADFGPIGRELVLFQDSDPVSLAGFSSGNTAWITIEYDHSLDAPKAPTNIAARYTQKVKISALHADPGPGTDKILLGQIVIGTDSVTDAVQKASLRITGAPLPVPTVTNFNPLTGGPGTSVTITGTNFTGATGVSFGGVAATTFTVNSATQVTATVPAGAGSGKIRVTSPVGYGETATDFMVPLVSPTVTSFNPVSGSAGSSVTITGTNFLSVTGVRFGGVAATTFTANSVTQITATVPTGAVTGKIRVTTPVASGESTTDFTVVPPPVIKSILPTSQVVGGTIVIRGSDIRSGALAPGALATGTTIRFVDPGNAANLVTAATGTVLTDVAPTTGPQRVQVTIPAKGTLPNLVDIVLEINGVSAISPQQFTFI